MKSSNRRTVTLNIELTIGLFKIVYVVRDSNVLHSGWGSFHPVIYIYILRSAEQTAVQEKRRQYTYDERIYKRILYELFYFITKQI